MEDTKKSAFDLSQKWTGLCTLSKVAASPVVGRPICVR